MFAPNHHDQIVDHYNNLSDTEKENLITLAQNDDKDSLEAWVKWAGKEIGIPVTAVAAAGFAVWFIKQVAK